ncbi:Heme uptake protein MmpL11 [bacterium HR15]|nr:Heme uptake protein MmpL11 [bacterium HR15]
MQKHFVYLGMIIVLAALAVWGLYKLPTRQGLDVKGGIRMTLRAEVEKLPPEEQQRWDPSRLNLVADILQKRIDSLGVVEPGVFKRGDREIVIELPGYTNEQEARELLSVTARLEFRYLKDVKSEKNPNARYEIVIEKDERGEEIVRFRDMGDPKEPGKLIKEGTPEYLQIIQNSPLIITGDDLRGAEVVSQTFNPEVALLLKPEAAEKFARATSLYLKEHIAIVLDDRIISAPVVESANLREPVIRGNFTLKEATRLRDLLRAGALPVSLRVETVNRIEPILGARAWERIIQAGVIGTILVAAFMMIYYLLPGVLAVIALGLYIVFSITAFKSVGVTFSLPAIAGFILSIGMAVDANILIFERVKEELRLGKTLLAAIDAGFKRAFPAIFDSNLSTIITCLILYNYGTGPVQGFATTLALGVLISFFTAITCTRTLLYTLVGLGVHPDVKWFGLRRQIGVTIGEGLERVSDRFDFVGRRRLFYGLSGALIAIGLVFWLGLGGLKPGIDFAGGSELVVESRQPIRASLNEVVALMRKAGFEKVGAQFAEGNRQLIVHVAEASDTDKPRLLSALQPLGELKEVSFASISPRIRAEIVQRAYTAVFLSLIAIMLYIAIRFSIEGGWSGFKFGIAAMLALAHDVLIVVGSSAMLGYLLGWEVNSLFLTALLTLVGFSVHDTIVVYDRIRENLRYRAKGETLEIIVNRSLNQTLARSINTSLTLVLVLIALMLWGAVTHDLRHFYVAMTIGAIVGTYSSIYIASQLIVDWEAFRARTRARQESALRATATSTKPASQPKPSSSVDQQQPVAAGTAPTEPKPKKPHRSNKPKRKRRY